MPSLVPDMKDMPPSTLQMVDLHYTNLVDWLISRGLAPDLGSYQAAQEYMDIDIQFAKSHFTDEKLASIQHDIAAMIRKEITYLEAKQILHYLEQVEKQNSSGSLFAYFSSEPLKSWQTLLRSWEKGNIHLVHAANRLISKVGHEEPNLSRKLQAAENTVRTIDNR
jgi:CDK5 regulatory subunit-associated protein 3